jgi:hypothetical protein
MMVQAWDVTEVEIDGRAFWVRLVGPGVLKSNHVVVALARGISGITVASITSRPSTPSTG